MKFKHRACDSESERTIGHCNGDHDGDANSNGNGNGNINSSEPSAVTS